MLHQKLREMEAKNAQAAELKFHLEQQNTKLTEIHRINNIEKSQFIEEFGIPHNKEYLAIYKDLVLERNEILASHSST